MVAIVKWATTNRKEIVPKLPGVMIAMRVV
jgi:hypothetical protein